MLHAPQQRAQRALASLAHQRAAASEEGIVISMRRVRVHLCCSAPRSGTRAHRSP